MRRFATPFLVWMLLTTAALAMNLDGTYTLTTASGTITVVLQSANQGTVTGNLNLGPGLDFRLQGRLDEDEVVGQVLGGNRPATFEAFLEDGQLYFSLIPHDAAGQPDFNQTQEYVFSRTAAAPAAPAGPPALPAAPAMPPAPSVTAPSGGFRSLNPAAGLDGTWYGVVDGQSGVLELAVQGGQLNGRLQAGAYLYSLQGMASGGTARGRMLDPAGNALEYEMVSRGSELQVHLQAADPQTGQPRRLTLSFSRNRPDTRAEAWSDGPAPAQPSGQANAGSEERDPSLVGSWSRTDSIGSGDASMSTRYYLQIQPDGTFVHSVGESAGGGAGWGMESGPGGSTQGRWRTSRQVVYIQEVPGGPWQPYARYYVEGNRMMFTFDNGNREIWYR